MGRPHVITSVVVVPANKVGVTVGVDCPTRVSINRIRIQGAKKGAFNATVFDRSFVPVPVPVISITDDGNTKCLVTFTADPNLDVGDSFIVYGNTVAGYNTTHAVTGWSGPHQVVTDQTFTAIGYGEAGSWQLDVVSVTQGFDNKTLVQFDAPHNLALHDTFDITGCSAYNTSHKVTQLVDTHTVLTDQSWAADAAGGNGQLQIEFSASAGDMGYIYEFIQKTASGANTIWRYDSPEGLAYENQDPPLHNMPVRKMYFLFDVADTYTITITSTSEWYG